jgi:hypothetical protein
MDDQLIKTLIWRVRGSAKVNRKRQREIVKSVKKFTGKQSKQIRKVLKEILRVNKKEKIKRRIKRAKPVKTKSGYRSGYKKKLINYVDNAKNPKQAEKFINRALKDLRKNKISNYQFKKLTNVDIDDIPHSLKKIDKLSQYSTIEDDLYEEFYDLIIQTNREKKLGLSSGPASSELKSKYKQAYSKKKQEQSDAIADFIIKKANENFK